MPRSQRFGWSRIAPGLLLREATSSEHLRDVKAVQVEAELLIHGLGSFFKTLAGHQVQLPLIDQPVDHLARQSELLPVSAPTPGEFPSSGLVPSVRLGASVPDPLHLAPLYSVAVSYQLERRNKLQVGSESPEASLQIRQDHR
jgi:hypothetical protein